MKHLLTILAILLTLTIQAQWSYSGNRYWTPNGNTASGDYSTAMGYWTTASGEWSTAMGYFTKATGDYSTSMGTQTTASGMFSTAMGGSTIASGRFSTAMGYYTIASDFASTVIGTFNLSGSTATSAINYSELAPAFVIGNGNPNTKSDAFSVLFNGNTTIGGSLTLNSTEITATGTELNYVDGVTSSIQTQLDSKQIAITGAATTIVSNDLTPNMALVSDANGKVAASPVTSTELGLLSGLTTLNTAGLVSVTENSNTGYRLASANASNHGDIGDGGLDLSYQPSASTTTGSTGDYSTAMGKASTASGDISIAMGNYTTASGYYSTAMGDATTASGNTSTAMGWQTTASDYSSTVIGTFNSSGSTATSATSFSTLAPAFVIGNGVDASNKSDAFSVLFNGNTTIGGSLTLNGTEITATGTELNYVDGVTSSIQAQLDSKQIAITGAATTIVTDDLTTSKALVSDANGKVAASDITSTELGYLDGVTSSIQTQLDSKISAGLVSVTENSNTGYRLASANASNHGDIGDGGLDLSYQPSASTTTGSTGDYSTAMGYETTASGGSSTAMGSNTTASGGSSIAMGYDTKASSLGTTAMGFGSTASADISTAMGNYTTASGLNSTAMGAVTAASGNTSTAMGNYTTATGDNSTAMGNNTSTNGGNSTAMGYFTTASGDNSTAMGSNTTASDYSSTVIGQYNSSGSTATSATSFDTLAPAFVIGNGADAANKSDAFSVLFNGTTNIDGSVTAISFTGDGSGLTNAGTDDQVLQNFNFSTAGSLLSIGIENGNVVSVNLAPLLDDLTTLVTDLQIQNAIQQDQIDILIGLVTDLQSQNMVQQEQIDDLVDRMIIRENCACDPVVGIGDNTPDTEEAYLMQNVPNPFKSSTKIGYFVPYSSSNAYIVISSITGQIIKNISLNEFGEGSIDVDKSNMSNSTYYYSLFVDGRRIETKKMIAKW